MRIEINAGHFSIGESAAVFHTDFNQFISDADSVIASFAAVKQSAYELPGGVGNMADAMDQLDKRIQQEEERKQAALEIQGKAEQLWSVAQSTDQQVAVLVARNQEEFYRISPHLRPEPDHESESFLGQAWDWLCGVGEAIADGVSSAINLVGEGLGKLWDSAKEFYLEHKKAFDTLFIVVGAVGAIVAVVSTGGLALTPLLGALGVSAAAATAISTAVAVVAVVSTVASSALNIADVWFEIDNTTFNAWQKGLNITAAVSNFSYSIGNIYNSIRGVSPQEYIARQNAIKNGKLGYDNLTSQHPRVKTEAGREFSATQKNAIYAENARRNNGVIRDDITGKPLMRYKSKAGVSKPLNGSEIDHIYPKSLGGENSFANARVINWKTNLVKSNDLTFDLNTTIGGVDDVANITDLIRYGVEGNFGTVTNYLRND